MGTSSVPPDAMRGAGLSDSVGRRQRALVAALLLTLVVCVFGQIAQHELVDADDFLFVAGRVDPEAPNLKKPNLRDGLTWPNVVDAFSTYYFWTPMSTLSIELNYTLTGDAPAGFLLGNLLLHAVSTLALFAFLTRTTGGVVASGFAAALFAIHPLNVEPVAWASGRKDALAACFWMLSLVAYARYRERPSGVRYALVALALVAGLLTKSVVVTLPLVLLLLDFWPLRRFGDPAAGLPRPRAIARAIVDKVPLLGLCGVASLLTLSAYAGAGNLQTLESVPLGLRVANAVDAFGWYLGKTVWPSGIAIFQPYEAGSYVPSVIPPVAPLMASAAALVGLTVWALWRPSAHPHRLVGWLWFVVVILPMIGVFQIFTGATASRYMYLPGVGLAIALVFEVASAVRGRPRAARVAVAAGCVGVAVLSGVAWRQVGTWRDTATLFEHAVAVTSDNWFAHRRLATLALKENRLDDATRHYAEVFRIRPSWARPHFELASALYEHGLAERSLEHWEAGLALQPNNPRAHGGFGLALLAAGRADEAAVHIGYALLAYPHSSVLNAAMARAYARTGQFERALAYHARAGADPRRTAELAFWFATYPDPAVRDPERALELAREALAAGDGSDPYLLRSLAAAQAGTQRFEDAIETIGRALEAAKGDASLAAALRSDRAAYRAGRLVAATDWRD